MKNEQRRHKARASPKPLMAHGLLLKRSPAPQGVHGEPRPAADYVVASSDSGPASTTGSAGGASLG